MESEGVKIYIHKSLEVSKDAYIFEKFKFVVTPVLGAKGIGKGN